MTGKTLWDVYKKPSQEKINAWRKIEHDINMRKGYNVKVYGGSYLFSVIYNYTDIFGYEHTVHETPTNTRDKIVYKFSNVKALYAESPFSGYGIIDINSEYCTSCVVTVLDDTTYINNIRKTHVFYTVTGKAYIVRYNKKLYIDKFLKIC